MQTSKPPRRALTKTLRGGKWGELTGGGVVPPPLLMHHQKHGRPSQVTLPSESKMMSRRSGSLPLYGGHSNNTLVPEMWQRHSSSLQQCSSPITWYLRRPLKKILQNGALGNTVIIVVQGCGLVYRVMPAFSKVKAQAGEDYSTTGRVECQIARAYFTFFFAL